ncbi:helix-turn-helix domain-containing protein [Vallitalea pronyensis]|uniref:Helix-turn-helix domain-containing protein n=1 Tax=Vallitalea pronyensis TaxID=1348613 RepID=A0A8J8SG58_9FIRM|nr:helix-turn-helix domain-containing protein [Vallitalea pronyensis]QUI22256.1 helix-turn-helix domain-containing protein [Vallitalea pronyensis]
MKKTKIAMDALTPYIRKAGVQGSNQWRHKKRRIYDHQWMFCTAGKAFYEEEGHVYTLVPGTLLYIEPDVPHSFWLDSDTPGMIKWVHFDFEYHKDVYDLHNMIQKNGSICFQPELPSKKFLRKRYVFEGDIELPKVLLMENKQSMTDCFDQIFRVFLQHKLSWQLEAKANWMLIMAAVISQLTESRKTATPPDHSAFIKTLCQYIEHNYHTKLTRKSLASYYGYNHDYLGKLFKGAMKKSISTYINELRIEKGKELLIHSDLTVENIAELIGYSDVYYFSKKMKAMTGMSPTDWRR